MKKIFDQPYVELHGKTEVMVDGSHGIEVYEEERIVIRLGEYNLLIKGKGLRLRLLSDDKAAVTGAVEGVIYV